jgi:hypothetical protein
VLNVSIDKPSDGEQLRSAAEAIATRIEREPAFSEQIRNHPWEALLAAGVPGARINKDLFEAIETAGDVSGYARPDSGNCTRTCGIYTCLYSTHLPSSQMG